jgi:hypothetical protein
MPDGGMGGHGSGGPIGVVRRLLDKSAAAQTDCTGGEKS